MPAHPSWVLAHEDGAPTNRMHTARRRPSRDIVAVTNGINRAASEKQRAQSRPVKILQRSPPRRTRWWDGERETSPKSSPPRIAQRNRTALMTVSPTRLLRGPTRRRSANSGAVETIATRAYPLRLSFSAGIGVFSCASVSGRTCACSLIARCSRCRLTNASASGFCKPWRWDRGTRAASGFRSPPARFALSAPRSRFAVTFRRELVLFCRLREPEVA